VNNLGFIPSWQMAYNAGPSAPTLNGLGFIPEWQFGYSAGPGPRTLTGLGDPLDTLNAVFDSWWWKNRKWVALGAVGMLGLGVLGGLTAILR
jgi:hypothetical protein